MSVILLATAGTMLVLPAFGRWLGRRLDPWEWARLTAVMLTGGLVVLEVALVLLSIPTLVGAVGVQGLAAACRRVLGDLAPGGVSIGSSAAVVAVLLPALAVRGIRRARRVSREMHVEAWLGHHEATDGIDLVVLPTGRLLAYSVDEGPRQIVISDGLADALAPDELAGVIRHERAHLRHRHQRYLLLAAAVESALPFLHASTRSLRAALERWADEDAAGTNGRTRFAVHRALLRVTGVLVPARSVAAFTTCGTVVERAAALAGPRAASSSAHRLVAYAILALLSVAIGVAFAAWGAEANLILSTAGLCVL